MDANHSVLETHADTGHILRTTVIAVRDDATVTIPHDGGRPLICDVLNAAGEAHRTLAVGDVVLTWHSGREEERGVILGRIGQRRTAAVDTTPPRDGLGHHAPDELVLEAKRSLTLRVGEGFITIREDGRILIKGRDLVSHAKRLNRVRGGSVQIN